MSGSSMNDPTNTPIVIAIVNHRARSALKKEAAVPTNHARRLRRRPGLRDLEDEQAEQRREDDRDQPGDQERYGDDGEQREAVLAGRALREASRDEARDRDQVPASMATA